MVEKQLSEEDIILDDIVTGPYKYGFKTEIETESFPKGLDLNIIQKIIEKKEEPEFLQKFRIRAFNFSFRDIISHTFCNRSTISLSKIHPC